jgi:integrase
MNESEGEITPAKTWQKTKTANLIRNVSSGNYYARFRVKGKLVWRCLDTDRISVATIRLADELKKERQKAGSGMAVAHGRMTVGDAVAVYRQRLQGSPQLKAKTKSYHEQRLSTILKSWPGLEKLDMAKITKTDCLNWAAKFGQEQAPSTFNHSLGILRQVFEIAVESGARYDNPANSIKRVRERLQKLRLPEREQFDRFIKEIETSGSGHAKPCANLVRFLAYGGFRITEARCITWADCDYEKESITVRGEPETGTKGAGDPRTVPMIPEMKQLLKRLQEERSGESATLQSCLFMSAKRP